MSTHMTRTALLLLVVAACSKSSSDAGPGAPKLTEPATKTAPEPAAKTAPAPEPPPVLEPVPQSAPELATAAGVYAAEYPVFDMTAAAKKLQGTWVFQGNFAK